MTVTAFDNVYEEKNTADIGGEASVLPPVLPTLSVHEKQGPSPAKKLNSQSDENKSPRRSALRTETSVNFPPKSAFVSQRGSKIDGGTQGNSDVINMTCTVTPL